MNKLNSNDFIQINNYLINKNQIAFIDGEKLGKYEVGVKRVDIHLTNGVKIRTANDKIIQFYKENVEY